MELSARSGHRALVRRPRLTLRAAVVVPARDEEERIGACLDALAGQDGRAARASTR